MSAVSGSAAAQGAEVVTFFSGSRSIYFSFHPEVIINGNRLINDFPDIELNRRYIVLEGWKLVDITYSKPDSAPPKSEYTNLAPNIREALIKTF